MGPENDSQENKKAIDYLDRCASRKNEVVNEVLAGLNERVTKEEVCTRIRADFFKSYMLRLKLANIKIAAEAPAAPVEKK